MHVCILWSQQFPHIARINSRRCCVAVLVTEFRLRFCTFLVDMEVIRRACDAWLLCAYRAATVAL